MRWNLLAEVLQIERGRSARTRAQLPEGGVSAELLLTEMMAQTAGLALGAQYNFECDVVFAKMDQAVFVALPPADAELHIEAVVEVLREEGSWFQARICCDRQEIASARLLLLNVGVLNPASPCSVTFHENFMRHYQIREKLSVSLGHPV